MSLENDIFGYKRNPKPKGVFSTEDSKLTFGSVSDPVGYLVQSWNFSYTQQVQELFEIGSNALYWSKGRPVGQGTISRVIGDVDVTSGNTGFFPSEAYDLCDGGATMSLSAQSGACDDFEVSELNVTMSGVVVTSIGFTMQVADVRLVENFGWRFAYLEIT
jgi:hypothetical protein